MIKVLHFELDSQVGGIESFLYNLYGQMDRSRIQFDFVTQSDKPALEEQFKSLGARIYQVSPIRNLRRYREDVKNIIDKGYDYIHVHKNSAANIVPIEMANRSGVPVIVHSHNTHPSKGRLSVVFHFINKDAFYRHSQYHFACSKVAGEWMYGKKDFEIIKNGIIPDRFLFHEKEREATRAKLGIPRESFVVGHVGRFSAQKNHSKLLYIFKELSKQNPSAKLLLIGDGNRKTEIEELANKLGIAGEVSFLGNRNDIPQLLFCMDAMVMPSLYEGLPIIAVEAQATGLPLFLADTISPEAEITDNVYWFSNTEDNLFLAQRILKFSARDRDRRSYNRLLKEQGFDIGETAEKLRRIYMSRTV